ncbi:MAG: hypothetical protein ACRDQ5_12350, partial [Sciscionella sp.]
LVMCAGLAWSTSALMMMCWGSVMLVLVTYPDGDTALYSWWFLTVTALIAALAAYSLVKVDPLGLSSRTPATEVRPRPARQGPVVREEVGVS